VVEDHLYHLVYDDRDGAGLPGKPHPIMFTFIRVRPSIVEKSPIVGETKYNHQALVAIGDALIKSFGSYHRLFWNCQVFADCFLFIITGGKSFVE